jgi:F0F1-type ATP synthase beta subunit
MNKVNKNRQNIGTIRSIRSSVVDVHFPDKFPRIHSRLNAGENGQVVIEVMTHLDSDVIRGVHCIRPRDYQGGIRWWIQENLSKFLWMKK